LCNGETPLLRRRPQRHALALATLATAFVHLEFATDAVAQSSNNSLFLPQLTDPRQTQRFVRSSELRLRSTATIDSQSSAGDTGFDSTGLLRKKKKTKRKAGEARSAPPAPPSGKGSAPQVAARASYANVYQPPSAPPRRAPASALDPYEPLGVRVGAFLLRPSFDISRGLNTNPGSQRNGRSSPFTAVEPALKLRSQWSSHEFAADLRGSFTSYDRMPSSDRPQLDARTFTRIDISRDTRVDVENRFMLSTDYPGSPNLPADIAKLPIFTTYGATAGLTQRFNRLELSGKASIDRIVYQDSMLTDGSTSSNHDRDLDQYGGQVRVGYEVMPGVKPFAEIGGDTRQHDVQFDRNGFQRDSYALTPKLGTTFELGRKLTGEVSVGYLTRHYKDPSLQELRGFVADASLVWAASGLTTATLTAKSRADELVSAGMSGMLRRDVDIQIDHSFRRWLIGTVKFGYGFDQYVGSERADSRTSLGTALTYKFNRDLSLKGEYRYNWLDSNIPTESYNASIYMVGLKLQR